MRAATRKRAWLLIAGCAPVRGSDCSGVCDNWHSAWWFQPCWGGGSPRPQTHLGPLDRRFWTPSAGLWYIIHPLIGAGDPGPEAPDHHTPAPGWAHDPDRRPLFISLSASFAPISDPAEASEPRGSSDVSLGRQRAPGVILMAGRSRDRPSPFWVSSICG